MESSYFMEIYKRRWKFRKIALGLCGLCFIALIGFGLFTYHQNLNSPTVVKTASDYESAASSRKYISISADHVYNLDLEMEETTTRYGIKTGESTTAYFVAVKLGDKLVPISLPINDYNRLAAQKGGPYIFKGSTTKFSDSDFEELKGSIKDSLKSKDITDDELDSLVFSDYLSYTSPMDSASLYFIIAAILLIIVSILFIPVMLKNTKALKKLENYSNGDLQSALNQIDNEIGLEGVYKANPVTITKSYIIVDTQPIVLAMPLKELMWTYKNIVRNKAYGVVTVNKVSNLVLTFSDGSQYKISINKNKQNIDEILNYIGENCKRTVVGYSAELGNLFKRKPQEFIRQWRESKECQE